MVWKLFGAVLIIWGVTDIAMSTVMRTDIWVEWLGIDLFAISELLWKYAGYLAIILGGVLWYIGDDDVDEEYPPQQ